MDPAGDLRAAGGLLPAGGPGHRGDFLRARTSAGPSTSTWVCSRDGLAPPVANNEVANLYQEFARGTFAMYITGPWNLGEFRRRLPDELQDDWATAPLPGPGCRHSGRVAGRRIEPGGVPSFAAQGSGLAAGRIPHPARAAGSLLPPDRRSAGPPNAWSDPALAADPMVAAFRDQLEHVVPTPKIPEWEQIATRIWEADRSRPSGARRPAADALAELDADVDRILAKRRWLLARDPGGGRP